MADIPDAPWVGKHPEDYEDECRLYDENYEDYCDEQADLRWKIEQEEKILGGA